MTLADADKSFVQQLHSAAVRPHLAYTIVNAVNDNRLSPLARGSVPHAVVYGGKGQRDHG